MLKSNYEFKVLVNGKAVDEYRHEGETFIEGKEETEFSLLLRNNSSSRVLFVPTIDGLSVMDGKEASFESSGYIVSGYGSVTVDGWRTSDNVVAKFFFARVKESYAASKGKEGNAGVIGCAVFEEKEREVEKIIIEQRIYEPRCSWGHIHCHGWCNGFYSSTAGGAGANPLLMYAATGSANGTGNSGLYSLAAQCSANNTTFTSASLGTGFGESKQSEVTTVIFKRTKSPSSLFEIRYNTRENLKEMGVQFKRPVYVSPSAFPKEERYCEPPKGWKGS